MDEARKGELGSGTNSIKPAARFAEVTLYTSQLESLYSFYANDLGLKVTQGEGTSFAVEIGESV